jgi:hypothetical protein
MCVHLSAYMDCMQVHASSLTYALVHKCACMHMHASTCACLCVPVRACACLCVPVRACMHVRAFTISCAHVNACMCICVLVCAYTCRYMHTAQRSPHTSTRRHAGGCTYTLVLRLVPSADYVCVHAYIGRIRTSPNASRLL